MLFVDSHRAGNCVLERRVATIDRRRSGALFDRQQRPMSPRHRAICEVIALAVVRSLSCTPRRTVSNPQLQFRDVFAIPGCGANGRRRQCNGSRRMRRKCRSPIRHPPEVLIAVVTQDMCSLLSSPTFGAHRRKAWCDRACDHSGRCPEIVIIPRIRSEAPRDKLDGVQLACRAGLRGTWMAEVHMRVGTVFFAMGSARLVSSGFEAWQGVCRLPPGHPCLQVAPPPPPQVQDLALLGVTALPRARKASICGPFRTRKRCRTTSRLGVCGLDPVRRE